MMTKGEARILQKALSEQKKLTERVATLEGLNASHARVNRRLTAEVEKYRLRADALAWALVLAQHHAKRLEGETHWDSVALAV